MIGYGGNDGGFLSSDHAVQYIARYFSWNQIIAALCRHLGKDRVIEIVSEEGR